MADVKGGGGLEAALRNIDEGLANPRHVRVGFLEGATYPDGTPVALVAAVNNFGAPSKGIPARPFMGNVVAEKGPTWGDKLMAILRRENYDGKRTLDLMGEGIKGEIQESITTFEGAPLKPETVARKGFDKQLIDTSHMLNSVDWEVRDGVESA